MEYAGSPFDIKSLDEAGHIEGLAAAFGNIDHGGDKILFGAMTKTLAARGGEPLPMLHSHDMARPIGAWKEWQERPDGLYVKGVLTLSSRDAQEAYALARDGGLRGISIGYTSTKESYGRDGVRVLPELELHEASLVAVPMNPKARVTALKSIAGARDIEELLRDAGMSGRKAKAAASAAWKAINQVHDEAAAEDELAAILKTSAARIAAHGVI